MKTSVRTLTAVFLGLFLAGCQGKFSALTPAFNNVPAPVPAVVYSPAQADNQLSGDIYSCEKSDSDNVFFSPFSIITALAMVSEGAKGNTLLEMQRVLHLSSDDNTRWSGFQNLIAEINKPGKGYQLSASNHLWVEQTFIPLPSFVNPVVQYYSAGVSNLDFINNPDGAALTISDTVSNETQGRITNLIPPGTLDSGVRLVLTNAIYFKADWLFPFEAAKSFPQNFYLNSGASIPAIMMNQNLPGSLEDYYGKAHVLELPYVNRDVSMFIFLPPAGQMAGLEAEMTGDQLNRWLASRVPPAAGVTQVSLKLPKFNFSTQYDLKSLLSTLGMPSAFIPGTADFSGIDGNKDLSISKVLHKAFVAVDEKGTEAAAATGIVVGISSFPLTVPFVVDHPFFFILYENTAHNILFMGKVNDPTR